MSASGYSLRGPAHQFDSLALVDSPIHRLDPRAKVITTLVYIVAVMSLGRYEIAALAPLCLFPLAVFSLSGLPARPLLSALLAAAPFAVVVGAFNPIFDRAPMVNFGDVSFSGGWVSFLSIILRFSLTVSAALLLIATTGMYRTSMALERMGVPRIFVLQLLFVYRYLFVLWDEAASLNRGRNLRSFGRPADIRMFGRLAGSLLLRTYDRALRIHQAMLGRGFDGTVRFLGSIRFRPPDVAFVALWCAAFALMRFVNIPRFLGGTLLELFR
jgi:cobalt/nickel transport system permease protein